MKQTGSRSAAHLRPHHFVWTAAKNRAVRSQMRLCGRLATKYGSYNKVSKENDECVTDVRAASLLRFTGKNVKTPRAEVALMLTTFNNMY